MVLRPPSLRLVTALCCLVALGAVTGAGAADSQVAIADSPDDETVGDVVELTVSMPENGTATVVVTATGDDAYERTVRLGDASGDGRVTLAINTFLGKRTTEDGTAYTATAGDEAALRSSIGGELPTGDYDIRVYNGTGTLGRPADSAAVELAAQTAGNASYEIAPANASTRLETLSDIRRGREAGWLTNRSTVAANDTLLVRLRVDGIEGAVATSSGPNDTERFRSLLDRQTTSLLLEKDENLMRGPSSVRLNRTGLSNIITVAQNDTYYVVVDTAEAGLTGATGQRVENGDVFEPHLVVGGESRLRDEQHHHQTYYDGITFASRGAVFATDPITVTRPGAVTVAGRTNLAPGTPVRVTLASGALSYERPTTVTAAGRFEVSVGIDPDTLGEEATLTVSSDGTVVGTATVEVRHTYIEAPASVSANADRVPVTVSDLTEGGVVYAVDRDGDSVARSRYIPPNETRNVSLALDDAELSPNETLTVVAAESDESRRQDTYVVDGRPLRATVELRAPSRPTDDGTATPTSNGNEPSKAVGRETPTTAAEGPGFDAPTGLLAVVLLLGAGRVGRR